MLLQSSGLPEQLSRTNEPMEQRVSDDLDNVECVWLDDKGRCDIVVCVTEKVDVLEPPIKKRLIAMSERGESGTKSDAEGRILGVRQGHTIKVHAISKQLVDSPYFRSYLKDSWNKPKETSLMELPLETCLASPQAYKRCIELLCTSEPCSAYVFASLSEALDIYLASDHLLLEKVGAVCMEYLASAQWSNEERQLLFEMFSTSGMRPSKDMAARLGLNRRETFGQSLSTMLWSCFQDTFTEDKYGHASCTESTPHSWGEARLSRFSDVLDSILHQTGHATMTGPVTTSRKIITEFVDRAIDYCFEKLKSSRKEPRDGFNIVCAWSEVPDWWVTDDYFLGWLQMMQLSVDHATNGKKGVEALAACDEVLTDLLFYRFSNPTFGPFHPYEDQSHKQADKLGLDTSARRERVVEKVVKLVAECFKKVAEADIVVSESTRNSLIKCWVPWLEAVHMQGKMGEVMGWHTLKDHISKILQTLRMDDEDVLWRTVEGAISGEYLMDGPALKAWCGRLD